MILHPAGHRSTVLIVIRYRIIGELAKSQLLGTSFAVALIAYPVYGEFSGCFSGIRTDIVTVIAVADPAAVRLSGFRIVVSPHTVYRPPAGFLCPAVVEQIRCAVDLLGTDRCLISHAVVVVPCFVDFLPAGQLCTAGIEQVQHAVHCGGMYGKRTVAVLILPAAVLYDPAAGNFRCFRLWLELRTSCRCHHCRSGFCGLQSLRQSRFCRSCHTAEQQHAACRSTHCQQGQPFGIMHFQTSFLNWKNTLRIIIIQTFPERISKRALSFYRFQTDILYYT